MGVAEEYRKKCAAHGWAFFDAEGVAEFNTVDYMHLSRRGHRQREGDGGQQQAAKYVFFQSVPLLIL